MNLSFSSCSCCKVTAKSSPLYIVDLPLLVLLNVLISSYLVSGTGKFFHTYSKSPTLAILENMLNFFSNVLLCFVFFLFWPLRNSILLLLLIFLTSSGNIALLPNISKNLLLKLLYFSYDSLMSSICGYNSKNQTHYQKIMATPS